MTNLVTLVNVIHQYPVAVDGDVPRVLFVTISSS